MLLNWAPDMSKLTLEPGKANTLIQKQAPMKKEAIESVLTPPSASDFNDTITLLNCSPTPAVETILDTETERRKEAARLLRTTNEFFYEIVHNGCGGVTRECFDLLEVICICASNNDLDPDLAKGCHYNLCWFASAILPHELIDDFLDSVDHILLQCPSWKAKSAILDVLQVSVFVNMPTIRHGCQMVIARFLD